MSDLEAFRDHCRAMATMREPVTRREYCYDRTCKTLGWHRHTTVVTPVPTATDRALWAQMAEEIDDHLATHYDQEQPMLGDA